jgi:diaminohydroxyphosphoribosylaminopyrimidine deaminase/5-amino-6-(5-phosphoribosylamino)uracil reductase
VDAVAVGAGTLLADDPLLTAREVYRERPLARVVFDRRLRTPANARVFSTLSSGPVIILTSEAATAAHADRAGTLEAAGALVVPLADTGLTSMLRALVRYDVNSVLLEGGASVHAAAWDAGVVDSVHLYVTPRAIGSAGVPLLGAQRFSPAALVESRVEALGPDVFIEGYVHRID